MNVIFSALASGVPSTITIAITNTKFIFGLDFRGLLVLIPIYLDTINKILHSEEYTNELKNICLSIIGSLICIPEHYSGYKIPSLIKPGEKYLMSDIKNIINEIIFNYLESSKDLEKITPNYEVKKLIKSICKALCCSTLIISLEIRKSEPDMKLMNVTLKLK